MSLTVLLIEDDSLFAESLSNFLEKEGHDVEHASTGEDGIRLFRDLSPDIVLQDLKLPGIDGLETLREIRKLDESASVIVMTGFGSIETAVQAMQLGVSLDELQSAVEQCWSSLVGAHEYDSH